MSDAKPIDNALESTRLVDESTKQYLSFLLADEEYGVEILRVQEIRGWNRVTHIPNASHFLCGVLNLRGTIVPVVDLRLRFDLAPKEYVPTTVVIVLKVKGVTERLVGIVVDSVSDTYNVKNEEIKPAPDFGAEIRTDFIKGLVANNIMILNIDRLLSIEALG